MDITLRAEKLLSYLSVLGDYHLNYQGISLQQTKRFLSYQSVFPLFTSLESCRITDLINHKTLFTNIMVKILFYLQFKIHDSAW